MKRIEISVCFEDEYGSKEKDFLSFDTDKMTDSAAMTYANDLANEWFYSIADDFCKEIWRERGGGSDFEYEFFFEKYIDKCSLNWQYRKEGFTEKGK